MAQKISTARKEEVTALLDRSVAAYNLHATAANRYWLASIILFFVCLISTGSAEIPLFGLKLGSSDAFWAVAAILALTNIPFSTALILFSETYHLQDELIKEVDKDAPQLVKLIRQQGAANFFSFRAVARYSGNEDARRQRNLNLYLPIYYISVWTMSVVLFASHFPFLFQEIMQQSEDGYDATWLAFFLVRLVFVCVYLLVVLFSFRSTRALIRYFFSSNERAINELDEKLGRYRYSLIRWMTNSGLFK